MKATPEQRVEGRRKALIAQGLSLDEASIRAHEIEGVPLPQTPDVVDPQEEIEDLHWKHTCEMRRADAATKRAALLSTKLRQLRAAIDAQPPTVVDDIYDELDRVERATRLAEIRRAQRSARRGSRRGP